ncbi:MAG: hydroxysqualene dehydroxylase HpnE [Bacteroidota bacterium]|nr:hydroxysqualene dehydroxylase HpnE [Candidatus Kapabacteria bacterium]MDW8219773.1 hydroxysqualene dehydroxylase HpnE [Bacteroidota bacterium]
MPHCIVIGGGFAGITAAIRLVEAGWRVTLIEARDTLGGRVQSLYDTTTGETIDNGQHIMMGCYEATLRLVHTLGTHHYLRYQNALHVWFAEPNNTPFRLDTSLLPGILGMVVGMMRLPGLSWDDKLSMLRFAARVQTNRTMPHGKSVRALLDEEGQSISLLQRVWEPITLATLNASLDEASATLFIEVLRRALFSGRAASRIILATTGLDSIVSTAKAWLEARGSTVLTDTAVQLNVHDNRVQSVLLKQNSELTADAFVSALPPHAIAKLLPSPHYQAAGLPDPSHFRASPIVSVYLWFDKEFMTQDIVALLGTTVQWIFNRRLLCYTEPETRQRFPCHIALTVSAASSLVQLPSGEIIQQCLRDIYSVFPSAQQSTILHARVIREKHATPLLTPTNEHYRPASRTAIHNLFLAGDWTATGLPATIESATHSGELAAQAVTQALYSQRVPIFLHNHVS